MKKLTALCLVLSFHLPLAHAGQLDFSDSGFSIESLDSTPTATITQPLMMMLPVKNGFAANVNVQIQPYAGTLKQYMELSLNQFEQVGFKVLATEEKETMATIEYAGLLQGRNLHWYAKIVKSGDHIYLVTATENELNWNETKKKLMSVVDSFTLK